MQPLGSTSLWPRLLKSDLRLNCFFSQILTTPIVMSETPFKISIPDESLALLRKKLELTTFPDELPGSGWAYGVPLADVRRLVERWTDGYDWKKHEAQLNSEIPQFTRDIEVDGHGTLNIHYVHKKSDVAEAIPLLFVHGWPGCFLEARKLLPLLTKGDDEFPAFHVVALSIPGFGFSQAPATRGFCLAQYAEVGNKLMLSLGYDEYVTQGGDWGYPITCAIAQIYGGKHSKAWHTNMTIGEAPPKSDTEPALTDKEKAGLERTSWYQKMGGGYLRQQMTQPQTLGYSLADSPAGLLGWIYEKLVVWADAYAWEDDEVLTWISIYWFSRGGTDGLLAHILRSRRLHGIFNLRAASYHPARAVAIPQGHLGAPEEAPSWLQDMGNIVFDAEHESGGHFAAYEKPEYLVGDLRKMFGKGGPAFGVVAGKSGYAHVA
ncbi:putative epoxide hydrolase [Mycena venus]|uniref:Putative epoxide hydrolase n=1 Tax=Mycena venus TaxID=2733690 RepID=A0A8H7CW89_9AGAR|nr:putative epoxide hydrolase [Mycena venus]